MDPKLLILAGIAVAFGFAMFSRKGDEAKPASDSPEDALSEGAAYDPDEEILETDGDDEVVAVTSDGFAIVPDVHAVRLVPPALDGEEWKPGARARNERGDRAMTMSWHAGDFTGGRVVRGDADDGPWRFEALGRDGEYAAFGFETREGADAALQAFTSRDVIRLGRDEDGNVMPPSAEQFAEARRVYLETEAALDATEEDER